MTVTGNLVLQSGATYLTTLNPTTASFASIGGTAAAFFLAGNYVAKKYTILTAAGGVNGTFNSLVNVNAPTNITSSLSYDANNAYLNLALSFVTPAGLNINQQNAAPAPNSGFAATNPTRCRTASSRCAAAPPGHMITTATARWARYSRPCRAQPSW